MISHRSRRGLWRYVRSFLATLLAVASLPDGAAGDAALVEALKALTMEKSGGMFWCADGRKIESTMK